jgi:cephalosporin hydroxylase
MFGGTWADTYWLGVPVLKCPLDLWIYQEIIFEVKPDVIIECGTFRGGSALFLAHMCDLVNNGRIISIDIEYREDRPKHERITYLIGSSTSEEIVRKVKSLIRDRDKVMVILDSDHHKEHVLKELKIYSKFVTKGSYLIVEDTNINGHPVVPDFGPGPLEAVEEFLKENKNFVADRTKEKFT